MRKDYRQTDEEWDRSRAQAQRSGGPGATVGRGSWVQAEDDTFSVERTGSPLVRPGYNKGEPLGDAGWNPSDIRSATAAAGLDPEDDVLALTPRMDLRPITAPGALPVAPGSRPTTKGTQTRGHDAAWIAANHGVLKAAATKASQDNVHLAQLLGYNLPIPRPTAAGPGGSLTAFPPGREGVGTLGSARGVRAEGRNPSAKNPKGAPFELHSPTFEGKLMMPNEEAVLGKSGRPTLSDVEEQYKEIVTPVAIRKHDGKRLYPTGTSLPQGSVGEFAGAAPGEYEGMDMVDAMELRAGHRQLGNIVEQVEVHRDMVADSMGQSLRTNETKMPPHDPSTQRYANELQQKRQAEIARRSPRHELQVRKVSPEAMDEEIAMGERKREESRRRQRGV